VGVHSLKEKNLIIQKWERLGSEVLTTNPWLTLRRDRCRLQNGMEIDDYYVLEEPDVACIVALTPDRRLLLVEQYKHGYGDLCIEIPGGVFSSIDADPEVEARREFREETGYDAPHWEKIAVQAVSPARTTIKMHLYLALDAVPVTDQHLDATEAILLHALLLEDVLEMIRTGEIHVSTTVSGILLALEVLRRKGINV
jgi:8-oxo-dGTP pyrophosphatase MutT (NUDIX family)